jgi:hypothetical protein
VLGRRDRRGCRADHNICAGYAPHTPPPTLLRVTNRWQLDTLEMLSGKTACVPCAGACHVAERCGMHTVGLELSPSRAASSSSMRKASSPWSGWSGWSSRAIRVRTFRDAAAKPFDRRPFLGTFF